MISAQLVTKIFYGKWISQRYLLSPTRPPPTRLTTEELEDHESACKSLMGHGKIIRRRRWLTRPTSESVENFPTTEESNRWVFLGI